MGKAQFWGYHDKLLIKYSLCKNRLIKYTLFLLSYYELLDISFHCFPLIFTEDTLHSGCPLPRGYHQLPAGGAGCKVFPAGQVAVHGIGRGSGAQE